MSRISMRPREYGARAAPRKAGVARRESWAGPRMALGRRPQARAAGLTAPIARPSLPDPA